RQLEAARQPETGALMRDKAVERSAVKQAAAGLVAQRAAETVDERALTGAVRADEADPLALGDRQIDILQRDKPAEALAEAADREERPGSGLGRAHAAACRCCTAASMIAARRRWRAEISPMIPFGAMMTNRISNTPTTSRFKAEESVSVAISFSRKVGTPPASAASSSSRIAAKPRPNRERSIQRAMQTEMTLRAIISV